MPFVDIARRARDGDPESFGELTRRFQGMAYGYACVLLGDAHLAQDATQEAFMDAYRNISAIRAPEAFPSWLRRVVYKHCDRLLRRKGLRVVPLEFADAVVDSAPLPGSRLVEAETERQAFAALNALPEPERAVTILHELRGYPQREVAAFLGIPLHSVKNRLRSARRKLAERMHLLANQGLNDEMPDLHERLTEVRELREACKRGDAARATVLLQRHPEIQDGPDRDERFTYPGSELWSPLHVAAVNGHEPLVRLLLDMGANPVPYEVAAQYHQDTYHDWMDVLRDRGHGAIAEGIRAAVAERYGTLVDDGDICRAAADANIPRVTALIAEKPERVRHVDPVGNTPLHHATAANCLELVRVLVDHGAPVDALNGDGRTPAVVALFGLHRYWRNELKLEILEHLLAHGAEHTPLIAASTGDEVRLRELLRVDPSLANVADTCRRRPLSGAAANGHTSVVRLLLEHGADPNAKEAICQGGLSLREAAGRGHTDIVRALLDHGAVPQHWVDSSGDAMFGAHHGGHGDIIRLLYAHGGTMELQVYSAQHRIDVIAEILRLQPSKADDVLPYGWDDDGDEDTACDIMRLAIRYGARFEDASEWKLRWTVTKYPRVFRLLCEHGAKPEGPLLGIAGDMRRRYADEADQHRHVVFLVEGMGADVNCSDEEGVTPLAKAAGAGHAAIVEYLL
ncbi:sigma-70 family RNA polymerase sigma factor, partial [Candidatus Poribacteria bacterium]|nr:sigma-70 family RNA polymerase sigma factor [Candidatus Poribacteria bacterium]